VVNGAGRQGSQDGKEKGKRESAHGAHSARLYHFRGWTARV
jgi:hypothetical protein